MRVAILRTLLAVLLTGGSLMWAETVLAGCGDVTDDQEVTTSDALAVLRLAVGQDIELSCTYNDVLLDFTGTPAYGQVNLTGGFLPDPNYTDITSGGPVDVSYLGTPCTGFAANRPDFRVSYTSNGSPLLRFYWTANGAGDATMIINDPDRTYRCDDDSFSTLSPTIDYYNPSSGTYDIWIASLHEGDSYGGALWVTGISDYHP